MGRRKMVLVAEFIKWVGRLQEVEIVSYKIFICSDTEIYEFIFREWYERVRETKQDCFGI